MKNTNISTKSVCAQLCCVQLFGAPWTIACQAPLPMGFSKQEYWSGLPFPSPGDFLIPGIKPRSPALQADFLPPESPRKPKNTEVGQLSSPGDLSDPGIKPQPPALQADTLPAELPRKPNIALRDTISRGETFHLEVSTV